MTFNMLLDNFIVCIYVCICSLKKIYVSANVPVKCLIFKESCCDSMSMFLRREQLKPYIYNTLLWCLHVDLYSDGLHVRETDNFDQKGEL